MLRRSSRAIFIKAAKLAPRPLFQTFGSLAIDPLRLAAIYHDHKHYDFFAGHLVHQPIATAAQLGSFL
jgi:hypothetical protein